MNNFGSYYQQQAVNWKISNFYLYYKQYLYSKSQVPYYYQVNDHYYHQYQTYPTQQDLSQSTYQYYNYDPYSYVPAPVVQQATTQPVVTVQTPTNIPVQSSTAPVNPADQQYQVCKLLENISSSKYLTDIFFKCFLKLLYTKPIYLFIILFYK